MTYTYCDQSLSPLYRLPPEIREQIFANCLIANGPITDIQVPNTGYHARFCVSEHRHVPPIGLAISRTCRRIHAETPHHVLWTSNTFRFTRACIADYFIRNLPPFTLALLRHLSCDLRGDLRSDAPVSMSWQGFSPWMQLVEWTAYLLLAKPDMRRPVCGGCHYRREPLRDFANAGVLQLEGLTFDLLEVDRLVKWVGAQWGEDERQIMAVHSLSLAEFYDLEEFVGMLGAGGVGWARSLRRIDIRGLSASGRPAVLSLPMETDRLSTWEERRLQQHGDDVGKRMFLSHEEDKDLVFEDSEEVAGLDASTLRILGQLREETSRQILGRNLPFHEFILMNPTSDPYGGFVGDR